TSWSCSMPRPGSLRLTFNGSCNDVRATDGSASYSFGRKKACCSIRLSHTRQNSWYCQTAFRRGEQRRGEACYRRQGAPPGYVPSPSSAIVHGTPGQYRSAVRPSTVSVIELSSAA